MNSFTKIGDHDLKKFQNKSFSFVLRQRFLSSSLAPSSSLLLSVSRFLDLQHKIVRCFILRIITRKKWSSASFTENIYAVARSLASCTENIYDVARSLASCTENIYDVARSLASCTESIYVVASSAADPSYFDVDPDPGIHI